MQKKSDDFSIEKAMRLAKTPAGQQLIEALKKNDSGQLKSAMDLAASGDYSKAKEAMSAMLNSPEIKKLMEQLGG